MSGGVVGDVSLSNQEQLQSTAGATTAGNSFQRISGIQGALNVPVFPFDYRNNNVSQVTIDKSATSEQSPLLLILALVGVGAYFVMKG